MTTIKQQLVIRTIVFLCQAESHDESAQPWGSAILQNSEMSLAGTAWSDIETLAEMSIIH